MTDSIITLLSTMISYIAGNMVYNPSMPLLFTQSFFWVFFTVVLAVYSVVYKNISLRNSFLFFISLYFYYKCSGWFVVMLMVSILAHYYIGNKLYKAKNATVRKWLVAASVFVSLLLLSYFKYTYFFTSLFNDIFSTDYTAVNYFYLWSNSLFGTHFDIGKILLPAGISFFTFHALSYTIDIYKGKTTPAKNVVDFGFYLAFFPQLVAGPIIRASEFIPQIYKEYVLTKEEFGRAVFLILCGLVKKMVLSDYISLNFVDRVFDTPDAYTGLENLLAVYGYALQIYCDFSGYTDIAIGIAFLLGFRIPPNFNSPYKANNLTDFWRRWHISLSSCLRDYLYIALGGNRKGKVRMYVNLIITMVLGGLWHGANWRFVIWGAIHGLGLIIHKLVPQRYHFSGKNAMSRFTARFLTFNVVCFAWIFFRAADMAVVKDMIGQMLFHFDVSILPQFVAGYWKVILVLLAGYCAHWFPDAWKQTVRNRFIEYPVFAKVMVSVTVILFIYQFKTSALQPFIYFQF
ncbi:MAG: MBOAT family protein [Fibrobacter sp.]|nr:MBOAT family protein [Fibrobacter sp.]